MTKWFKQRVVDDKTLPKEVKPQGPNCREPSVTARASIRASLEIDKGRAATEGRPYNY